MGNADLEDWNEVDNPVEGSCDVLPIDTDIGGEHTHNANNATVEDRTNVEYMRWGSQGHGVRYLGWLDPGRFAVEFGLKQNEIFILKLYITQRI